MSLTLYRLQPKRFWTGSLIPAHSEAGRWHKGRLPVVYLAESPALATLEFIKGMSGMGLMLREFAGIELLRVAATLDIDPAHVRQIDLAALPDGWHCFPNTCSAITQQLGNEWLAGNASLALRVPSATLLCGDGWNVLLNAQHPDYSRVLANAVIRADPFDLRHYLGISDEPQHDPNSNGEAGS